MNSESQIKKRTLPPRVFRNGTIHRRLRPLLHRTDHEND
ncbi:BnaC05g16130D [Brassica napus]|uniref:BnaC05g16130D protein n=1 Tax=Brassica napus TaxID=3708 RepID=A0A078H239_BRANA|nr:BnaC05g16130D [Brassica napus]